MAEVCEEHDGRVVVQRAGRAAQERRARSAKTSAPATWCCARAAGCARRTRACSPRSAPRACACRAPAARRARDHGRRAAARRQRCRAASRIVDSQLAWCCARWSRATAARCCRSSSLPDRRERIRAALERSDADVILVSGGSSVGQRGSRAAPRRRARDARLPRRRDAAVEPGGRRADRRPRRCVFLLPGQSRSAACAPTSSSPGPTIRALGGRSRAWPHRRVRLPLARKISSADRPRRLRARRDRGRPRRAARDLGRVDPVLDGARRRLRDRAARARGHARGRRGRGAALRRRARRRARR